MFNNDLGNFQNGVDTIVNGCTTYGSTPSTNTPSDIVESIKTIYTNRYNSGYNTGYPDGRTQGQNDVTSNPNGYGLYTQSQYNSNYNSGYSNGVNVGSNANMISRHINQRRTNTADYYTVRGLTVGKTYVLLAFAANAVGPGNIEIGSTIANVSGCSYSLIAGIYYGPGQKVGVYRIVTTSSTISCNTNGQYTYYDLFG